MSNSAKLLQYLGLHNISIYNPSGEISDLIIKVVKMISNQDISPEPELIEILEAIAEESANEKK